MDHFVIDIETISNCFVLCAEHYKLDTKLVFVIHELRDDTDDLIDFLWKCRDNGSFHISFNGLAFDSQVLEMITRGEWDSWGTPEEKARAIYTKAQEVIQKSNAREFQEYPEWKLSIQQIDVFKMNHWDNPQRSASLKWVQFSMDWYNVQEMPIHHGTKITTLEEIETIISYCQNDVSSTKKVMGLSKPLLDVRRKVKEKYELKCLNYSNTKLGSELLLKLYCNKTNRKPYDVKQYRTPRTSINIKDILFPYISFQSPELQQFLKMLHTRVIVNTKKDFTHSMVWKGSKFYYGAGGIHQCIKSGIYLSDDKYIIKDLDAASLYPSIACVNHMYPAHLGQEFYKVYKEGIVDVRLAEKAKKLADKDIAIIEGFKEAANASYGNSNSPFSWLYDPQYTMQTTINGQLLITMLVEDLLINIPDASLLQTNTDGATLRYPRQYQGIYDEVCKSWEIKTGLMLEFAEYSKMVIRDVNNYLSVYTNGKTKCKGSFEWEDLEKHKYSSLSKNKSHLIIPKAIYNYFVNDIVPEIYLQQNRNIFDYCGGVKSKGNWYFKQTCVVNRELVVTKLQKVVRYYISNQGCKILKYNPDGRDIQIEKGEWMQTEFNKYIEKPWGDYNVNEDYYLSKIYAEIGNIKPKKSLQTTLF